MSNDTPRGNKDSVCTQCRREGQKVEWDYYWRDYVGQIPKDAIEGGLDLAGQKTYIGQGIYSRAGLLPGTIYPGSPAIKVAHSGSNNTEAGVKILCSPNSGPFTWVEAKSSTLHATTIGKHLVIGGYEDGKIVNVGRAMYQGELVVGKVLGFEAEKAKMYFVHKEKEVCVTSYQVLVYNTSRV